MTPWTKAKLLIGTITIPNKVYAAKYVLFQKHHEALKFRAGTTGFPYKKSAEFRCAVNVGLFL